MAARGVLLRKQEPRVQQRHLTLDLLSQEHGFSFPRCYDPAISPRDFSRSPEPQSPAVRYSQCGLKGRHMGKGILLWLLGVPIPIILLLWFFFH